eukprot:TRINITY_DN35882_c0_g1_i1.p1 TRINITY_DN35882_c0_g1~~TRINITY_DN35882_c0_g1_i1.p1  ORF type:complete len:605 (+),score=237.51 TRINITY_DN35882_c0_g1_i1:74-1888(+)
MGGSQSRSEESPPAAVTRSAAPAKDAPKDLPKWLKVGKDVQAQWEGEWWPATVTGTSRRKWQVTVEWAAGGFNEVSVDEVRVKPVVEEAGPSWDSRKLDVAEERKLKQREKARKAREKEAAEQKEAARQLQRKLREERAAEKADEERRKKGSPRRQDARDYSGVAAAAKLFAGLICLPLTAACLLLFAFEVAVAGLVGAVTAAPLAAILYFGAKRLRGVDRRYHAGNIVALTIAEEGWVLPQHVRDSVQGLQQGDSPTKKMSAKERRQQRRQEEDEIDQEKKKQWTRLIQLSLVLVGIVAALVIFSLLDIRKEASGPDLYGALGLTPETATDSSIQAAYKKLSRQWHPDKYRGAAQEQAKLKMALLNDAKKTLLDPAAKQEYDDMRDRTSKFGYVEPTFGYATRYPVFEFYSSCPDVVGEWTTAESLVGVVCAPVPLSHFVHAAFTYLFYVWAHFGDCPLEWRRAAAMAGHAAFLATLLSFCFGGVLLLQHPASLQIALFTFLALPLAWAVEKLLTAEQVEETKVFVEGGRPVMKERRTQSLPAWVPAALTFTGAKAIIGGSLSFLHTETVHLQCPDGEVRLVGKTRVPEVLETLKTGVKIVDQ